MEQFEPALERALEQTELGIVHNKCDNFLNRLVHNFIAEKISEFPKLCLDARKVNWIQNKELEAHGIKGKYTDSYGWSKDGNFKHKWVIPTELMFFMRNLIYIDFWDDSNEKVRDSFMRAILRGDDPMELLKKVRMYYGNNPDKKQEMVINGPDNSGIIA